MALLGPRGRSKSRNSLIFFCMTPSVPRMMFYSAKHKDWVLAMTDDKTIASDDDLRLAFSGEYRRRRERVSPLPAVAMANVPISLTVVPCSLPPPTPLSHPGSWPEGEENDIAGIPADLWHVKGNKANEDLEAYFVPMSIKCIRGDEGDLPPPPPPKKKNHAHTLTGTMECLNFLWLT